MANDITFNISLGCSVQMAKNVDAGSPANSALILIPLETSGLEADATLRDYDTVGAILAAANNEQSTMGRKTITGASVTVTIDDTNNKAIVIIADQTYTAATGNAISGILFGYDADTTGGSDTDIVPITKHGAVVTPDGSDITFDFDGTNGILQAA